jgi:MFS family permease
LNYSDTRSSGKYGYVIVLFSFFIQAIGLSLIFSFGLFFNPIQNEFGWNRATISMASTLNAFVSGLSSVIAGIANDHFGPRVVMTVYGIFFGIGYFMISRVTEPWHLYLSYGVAVGIGQSAINAVLLPTVARWFDRNRGLMTGLVKAGAGTGIFVMPFIVIALIQGTQWRHAAMVLGIASGVIMVVASQFLQGSPIRRVAVAVNKTESRKENLSQNDTGLTLRQALATKQFWLLCLVFAALMYTFQTVQLHVVPYARDAGFNAASAALVVSIIGIVSIVGRIAFGIIGDRWGNKLGFILCSSILVVAIVWLQLSHGLPMLYMFAVLYGMFHGSYTVLTAPTVAGLFGTRNVGSIFGATQLCGIAVGSLGGVLTGYFYDKLGSYTAAFFVCIALAVLALAVMFLIRPVTKSHLTKF